MRAVLQRVLSASVTIDGHVVSSVGRGVCVLVGIASDDTLDDVDYMVKKILGCRVFSNADKMWTRSVVDLDLDVLCVSQFTLYGTLRKGLKPDFHRAMGSETSKAMYQEFLNRMKTTYKDDKVHDGVFGAMMVVDIQNDGPVTLELDSRKFTQSLSQKFVQRLTGKEFRNYLMSISGDQVTYSFALDIVLVANWGLPLAAMADMKKDPAIISPNMTAGTRSFGLNEVGSVERVFATVYEVRVDGTAKELPLVGVSCYE